MWWTLPCSIQRGDRFGARDFPAARPNGRDRNVAVDHSDCRLDDGVAVIHQRQVHVNGVCAGFQARVLCRNDAAFHRGKFRMAVEKALHLFEIAGCDHQVIVEEDHQLAARFSQRTILDAALSGSRFVQMLQRRAAIDHRWLLRSVLRDEQFAFIA